ncbi:MAG: hypothetical protein DMG49_01250 [Acidobacteria bacterium]|nr:MAG: hypothetical protein DMG49_01250 [Acidobacteriota bacterium]
MKTKKKATRAKKLATPKRTQVRSKAARAHIAEGTRLFALAGRPTKAQFVKVYGPLGPKMTWEQRAKQALTPDTFRPPSLRKAWPENCRTNSKALSRESAEGLCLCLTDASWVSLRYNPPS